MGLRINFYPSRWKKKKWIWVHIYKYKYSYIHIILPYIEVMNLLFKYIWEYNNDYFLK